MTVPAEQNIFAYIARNIYMAMMIAIAVITVINGYIKNVSMKNIKNYEKKFLIQKYGCVILVLVFHFQILSMKTHRHFVTLTIISPVMILSKLHFLYASVNQLNHRKVFPLIFVCFWYRRTTVTKKMKKARLMEIKTGNAKNVRNKFVFSAIANLDLKFENFNLSLRLEGAWNYNTNRNNM